MQPHPSLVRMAYVLPLSTTMGARDSSDVRQSTLLSDQCLELVEYALAGSEESEMLTREKPIAATEPIGGRATRANTPSTTARDGEMRSTPAIRDAILRVEGEYREMPGLNLTLPQAARLLGLDQSTCERVLAILIERRVLKRALNGTYVRRRFGQAR